MRDHTPEQDLFEELIPPPHTPPASPIDIEYPEPDIDDMFEDLIPRPPGVAPTNFYTELHQRPTNLEEFPPTPESEQVNPSDIHMVKQSDCYPQSQLPTTPGYVSTAEEDTSFIEHQGQHGWLPPNVLREMDSFSVEDVITVASPKHTVQEEPWSFSSWF